MTFPRHLKLPTLCLVFLNTSCGEKPAARPLDNTTAPVAETSEAPVAKAPAPEAAVQPASPPVEPPPPPVPSLPPLAPDAPEVLEARQAIRAAGEALANWKEGDSPEGRDAARQSARQALAKLGEFRSRIAADQLEAWEKENTAAKAQFIEFQKSLTQARLAETQKRLKDISSRHRPKAGATRPPTGEAVPSPR
jgi:hypothetical protein